jgi:hypothetical protein
MKTLPVLALVTLFGAGATSAAAQGVALEFHEGRVNLKAQGVLVSQILSEWARRGRTTIVNGERVPGPPVTIELQDVPEQLALDVVLRSASGYLAAERETAVAGASAFDRIYVLPTSSRPVNAAPLPAQQAQQVQDDPDNEPPPPGGRGAAAPVRLPPGVVGRPPVPLDPDIDREDPETRPASPPGNPFGVAPGTARPGVISPVPTNRREQ